MSSVDPDIAASIAQYGWTAIGVNDRNDCYVYSVGLMFSASHPELIITGLPDEGPDLIQHLVHQIADGRSFARTGVFHDVLDGVSLAVRTVHPSNHYHLFHADHYARAQNRHSPLAAVQIFWPDDGGFFPFNRECSEAVNDLQMRLDVAARELRIQETA